jgi:hypothetical protein
MSLREHHELVLSSHIKQVSNKPIYRKAKKNLHLLKQNKRDAQVHIMLRNTQKEGMKGIQCKNPSQSYHEGKEAKKVRKKLGKLYENKA